MTRPIVQNQLCSVENPKEEEVADDGSGCLVCPYAAHILRLSTATVCLSIVFHMPGVFYLWLDFFPLLRRTQVYSTSVATINRVSSLDTLRRQ